MPSPRGDVSLSRVWVGAWHRGYQFGAQVLHQLKTLGVMLSADVDRCAAGGHLMAVALERLNLACELRHGSHKVGRYRYRAFCCT